MKIRNKSFGGIVFDIVNHLLMVGVIAACIIPVLHVAFASFSDPAWVMGQGGVIWRIKGFNLNGYKLVLANKDLLSGYLNTIFYVVASTALGILITVLTAYVVSRKEALWANPIMFFISLTMLFNGGLIATYIVVTKGFGLYNSRLAIILPTCVSAFNIILVRTAMTTIPPSLEESAMLDGAGRMTILFKIILPLIKATLATVILFNVIAQWNSWFQASIYLNDRSKYPLQLILKEILVTGDTNINTGTGNVANDFSGDVVLYKQLIKYCTIMVSTVPVFILYPFIQKYFESGIMIGAIKG